MYVTNFSLCCLIQTGFSVVQVPGLNINVQDGAMMTALMWAAFHGKPNHIKVLLEKGADPAISDVDGMTAVHWSVQRHDTRALQVDHATVIESWL